MRFMTMMETNLPDSGFLTCFYYTGRHTTDLSLIHI